MNITASSRWLDGERFLTQSSSGHAMVVDADRTSNSAPSPMELVLMGLCSCTSVDVVNILRKKRQTVWDVTVTADAERADEPPRVYTAIRLVFRVTGAAVDRKAVEDAVRLSKDKYCSVSRMLEKTATITHEIMVMEAETPRRDA
jgi:putative redox protein